MLKISEQSRSIHVEGGSIEVGYLKEAFSFDHPNAAFLAKRAGLSTWGGKVKFYRSLSDGYDNGKLVRSFSIGVGMKKRLLEALEKEGLEYEYDALPVLDPIPYRDDLMEGVELDDIQKECLAEMLKHQTCAIELGTGSGKSEIFFMAIACYLSKFPEARVLVVTSKKVLLRDLESRFKKRLPQYVGRFGLLGDSHSDLKQIVVATPNSSRNNTKLIAYKNIAEWKKGVDLLIFDEAHHGRSKGWLEVVSTCKPKHLWAVSGKMVYKTSDLKTAELEAHFGPPVFVGASKVRTVPVLAVFHQKSWGVDLEDYPDLSPMLTTGTPVFYRSKAEDPWLSGVWMGPDETGLYPLFMLDSACCKSRVSLEEGEGEETFLRCEQCGKTCKAKADKTKCGIYTDCDSEVKVEPYPDSENVIYWSPYDQLVMEFGEFNRFYANLANDLSGAKEKWLISVRRSRQILKFRNLFSKEFPKLRVGFVDGKLSGKNQLETFRKLERGELDGVVSQYIISAEGVDVPSLLHFIKLDNLSSEQLLEQQKGRVERASGDKVCGYIHIPTMSQHPSLARSFDKIRHYYRDLRKLECETVKYGRKNTNSIQQGRLHLV